MTLHLTLAHLLHILFDLCLLIGRKHVHDLLMHLLHRLRIRRTALRVRLPVLRHDLLDLLFLLIAEINATQRMHECAAVMVTAAAPGAGSA